ncbi:MAG TPA: hypothetical protein VMW91_03140 [Desulfosporosinus sp.]|nr:hypothetical protein [Desulfosporosinus sp.]
MNCPYILWLRSPGIVQGASGDGMQISFACPLAKKRDSFLIALVVTKPVNEMKLQRESLHAILGTATSVLPWTSHQAGGACRVHLAKREDAHWDLSKDGLMPIVPWTANNRPHIQKAQRLCALASPTSEPAAPCHPWHRGISPSMDKSPELW